MELGGFQSDLLLTNSDSEFFLISESTIVSATWLLPIMLFGVEVVTE